MKQFAEDYVDFSFVQVPLAQLQEMPILRSLTAKLQTSENQANEIWQSAITKLEKWATKQN